MKMCYEHIFKVWLCKDGDCFEVVFNLENQDNQA